MKPTPHQEESVDFDAAFAEIEQAIADNEERVGRAIGSLRFGNFVNPDLTVSDASSTPEPLPATSSRGSLDAASTGQSLVVPPTATLFTSDTPTPSHEEHDTPAPLTLTPDTHVEPSAPNLDTVRHLSSEALAKLSQTRGLEGRLARARETRRTDFVRWRDLSGVPRLEAFTRALMEAGTVRPFTLDLNEATKAAALAGPEAPHTYLVKRLRRHLKAALGREPLFWIVTEDAPGTGLHAHGVIQLEEQDARHVVKLALRLAGGVRDTGSQFQVKLRTFTPDRGWSTYNNKHTLGFAAPRETRQKAQALHEAYRSNRPGDDQSKLTYAFGVGNKTTLDGNKMLAGDSAVCDDSSAPNEAPVSSLGEPTSVLASPSVPSAVLDLDFNPARAAQNVFEAFANLAHALGIDPADKRERFIPDEEHRATSRLVEAALVRFFGVERGSFDAAGFLANAGLLPQSVDDDLNAERFNERLAGRLPTPTAALPTMLDPRNVAEAFSPGAGLPPAVEVRRALGAAGPSNLAVPAYGFAPFVRDDVEDDF